MLKSSIGCRVYNGRKSVDEIYSYIYERRSKVCNSFPWAGKNSISDRINQKQSQRMGEGGKEIDWHVSRDCQRLPVIAGESCRERIKINNLACVRF